MQIQLKTTRGRSTFSITVMYLVVSWLIWVTVMYLFTQYITKYITITFLDRMNLYLGYLLLNHFVVLIVMCK